MKLLSLILKHIPNKTKDNTIKDMILTSWFDGRIKPVHIGVYERKSAFGFSHYSYWNGDVWKQISSTPDRAKAVRWDDDSHFQYLDWRGICQ
jgi:hypothetical protein